MFHPRTDIPFSRDEANRYLPWIIGFMTALSALTLCAGLTLGRWVMDNQHSYGQGYTVHVPASADASKADLENMLDYLRKQPETAEAKPIERNDIQAMVEPWLGSAQMLDELPLPSLIDVQLKNPKSPPSYNALRTQLSGMIAGTQVDAQEEWVAQFSSFSRTLELFAYGLAGVILLCLTAIIIFTSRTALRLHGPVVTLLHSIGADDEYVASQFQWNACAVTFRGALPGTLLAAALFGALGLYAESMHSPLLPQPGLTLLHIAMLLILPFACAAIALVSSRLAVMNQLSEVL